MTYLGGPSAFFNLAEDEQATILTWYEMKVSGETGLLSSGPVSASTIGYFLSQMAPKGKSTPAKKMISMEEYLQKNSPFNK